MQEPSIDQVAEVLGEIVDLSGVNVDERAVLGEDIPLDSKEMLRVVSRIESLYRFHFAPGDLLGVQTVGDLLDAIRRGTGGGCGDG